jgi:hypothetical protein
VVGVEFRFGLRHEANRLIYARRVGSSAPEGRSGVKELASVDLIDLVKQNPAAVAKYTIKQIVGICGDGDLRVLTTFVRISRPSIK